MILNQKIYIAIAAIVFAFLPTHIFAAKILFDAPTEPFNIGEMIKVSVLVDPQGETINGVESTIQYPSDLLRLVRIEDGESFVPLWLERPTLAESGVHSSGIIPRGFSGLIKALEYPKVYPGELFTVIFEPLKAGNGVITAIDSRITLNDGTGNMAKISIEPRTVSVSNMVNVMNLSVSDTVSPDFTVAEIHSENSLGGLNLIFVAADKESGIDHYEIQDGSVWRVIESPYRIEGNPGSVTIKAVDRAGNERLKKVYLPEGRNDRADDYGWLTVSFVAALTALIVGWIWLRHRRSILKP